MSGGGTDAGQLRAILLDDLAASAPDARPQIDAAVRAFEFGVTTLPVDGWPGLRQRLVDEVGPDDADIAVNAWSAALGATPPAATFQATATRWPRTKIFTAAAAVVAIVVLLAVVQSVRGGGEEADAETSCSAVRCYSSTTAAPSAVTSAQTTSPPVTTPPATIPEETAARTTRTVPVTIATTAAPTTAAPTTTVARVVRPPRQRTTTTVPAPGSLAAAFPEIDLSDCAQLNQQADRAVFVEGRVCSYSQTGDGGWKQVVSGLRGQPDPVLRVILCTWEPDQREADVHYWVDFITSDLRTWTKGAVQQGRLFDVDASSPEGVDVPGRYWTYDIINATALVVPVENTSASRTQIESWWFTFA